MDKTSVGAGIRWWGVVNNKNQRNLHAVISVGAFNEDGSACSEHHFRWVKTLHLVVYRAPGTSHRFALTPPNPPCPLLFCVWHFKLPQNCSSVLPDPVTAGADDSTANAFDLHLPNLLSVFPLDFATTMSTADDEHALQTSVLRDCGIRRTGLILVSFALRPVIIGVLKKLFHLLGG
jgi:hypothetical protein